MNYKRLLGAARTALMIVTIATLVWAPSVWAQSTYKTLYNFRGGADGANPYASLVFDQAGNLYGTTEWGGDLGCGLFGNGCGSVFELTPNQDGSWTKTELYGLTYYDGAVAVADLIFDAAGNLYSTTFWGGTYCNCGVVFELTPGVNGTWTNTVLHSWGSGADGTSPTAGLTWDTAGNLYGTDTRSSGGDGLVFELTPNADGSWTESTLHNFRGGADGAYPDRSGLLFDAAGNLYGTTAAGGKGNCTEWTDGYTVWPGCGTIFELTPNSDGTWTEHMLHVFTGGKEGTAPESLTFDNLGNLYGTTIFGGAYGYGSVFELIPNGDGSWKEKVLHQFRDKDGAEPYAVTLDAAGNLYGTTFAGGNLSDCGGQGCGVIFKLTLGTDGTWTEQLLHSFTDHPAAYPYAGLIFDAAGNLYGTTSGDGSATFGSVFEITP